MTTSLGINARRQLATDANLFDVLASRSELDGECLIYTAQPSDDRPKISYNGKMIRSYVAVYQHVHGYVTDNVLHTCNRSRCWNPMHLYDGTHQHNMLDNLEVNWNKVPRGEQQGNSRFTYGAVLDMRMQFHCGARIADIAKRYDADRGTVSHIVYRDSWRHIP